MAFTGQLPSFPSWELTKLRPCSISGVELDGDNLSRYIYIDESGTSVHESVTVVAGVIVNPDKQWKNIEKHLAGLVAKYIPPEHHRGFCFHAKDLFHGTKLLERNQGHAVLKDILSIPSKFGLPLVFGTSRKKQTGDTSLSTKKSRRWDASSNQAKAYCLCVLAAECYMQTRAGAEELATLVAENNTDTQRLIDRIHYIRAGWILPKTLKI